MARPHTVTPQQTLYTRSYCAAHLYTTYNATPKRSRLTCIAMLDTNPGNASLWHRHAVVLDVGHGIVVVPWDWRVADAGVHPDGGGQPR